MNADIRWLDDPEVFRVNQLPAHSDHEYYVNMEELQAGKSSLAQSLNGVWKFWYSENAMERPEDFFRFFGIFRNVMLYAKPGMHVEDLWAKPVLHADGGGSLGAELKISMEEGMSGRMEISLEDDKGEQLLKHEILFEGDRCRDIWRVMKEQELGPVKAWELPPARRFCQRNRVRNQAFSKSRMPFSVHGRLSAAAGGGPADELLPHVQQSMQSCE